jgi:hypothetical protein
MTRSTYSMAFPMSQGLTSTNRILTILTASPNQSRHLLLLEYQMVKQDIIYSEMASPEPKRTFVSNPTT